MDNRTPENQGSVSAAGTLDFTAPRLVGMIHVGALPGTPRYDGDLGRVLERVGQEARLYRKCGVDAVLVENMHDVPYLNRSVGPEITAAMTQAGRIAREASGLPTGIQILAGANREALAAALAANLDFIRAEGFVFAHVADEGLMNGCAGDLLRYRRDIGAEKIAIWADIKKKHASHALTADVDIAETARAAAFFGADALVVTGVATGRATAGAELKAVRQAFTLPVVVGSGMTCENLHDYAGLADAFIVGSHFKTGGSWDGPVEAERVRRFVSRLQELRGAAPSGTEA